MDTFYDNTTLVLGDMKFLLSLAGCFQNLRICQILLIFFIISFDQLVKNLTFFQSTMSYCSKYGIPVTETVFAHNRFQKLWFRINSDLISL